MSQILVTGANGFVGRAVCQRLLADGCEVRGTVRSAQQRPPGCGGLEVRETGPVERFDDWESMLDGVSEVIHLVARAHVLRENQRNPLQAYRSVNVAATERLLDACELMGVRRFVFVSSIGAVGRRFETPVAEDAACHPADDYGQSKYEAEQVLAARAASSSFETVIIRPPLVYGPGVGGNFARILRLTCAGVPLPVGALRSQRSMVGLENLVDALVTCLGHPQAGGQVFHVSDDETLTTRDLVRLISDAAGRRARSVPVPLPLLRLGGLLTGRSKDVGRLTDPLLVSSQKIRSVLGWKPQVSAEEGIRRTVLDYLRQSEYNEAA